MRRAPVRIVSCQRAGRASVTSLLNGVRSPAVGCPGRTSQTSLGRARKLRVRSYVFLPTGLTSEMSKLGTHPAVPCPRRSLSPPQGGPRKASLFYFFPLPDRPKGQRVPQFGDRGDVMFKVA